MNRKHKSKEQKIEEFKSKQRANDLANKAILQKRANKKRALEAKKKEEREKFHAEIAEAKARGESVGFQPSPVVRMSHKSKKLKEPLSGFNPFSKATQLGKKK